MNENQYYFIEDKYFLELLDKSIKSIESENYNKEKTISLLKTIIMVQNIIHRNKLNFSVINYPLEITGNDYDDIAQLLNLYDILFDVSIHCAFTKENIENAIIDDLFKLEEELNLLTKNILWPNNEVKKSEFNLIQKHYFNNDDSIFSFENIEHFLPISKYNDIYFKINKIYQRVNNTDLNDYFIRRDFTNKKLVDELALKSCLNKIINNLNNTRFNISDITDFIINVDFYLQIFNQYLVYKNIPDSEYVNENDFLGRGIPSEIKDCLLDLKSFSERYKFVNKYDLNMNYISNNQKITLEMFETSKDSLNKISNWVNNYFCNLSIIYSVDEEYSDDTTLLYDILSSTQRIETKIDDISSKLVNLNKSILTIKSELITNDDLENSVSKVQDIIIKKITNSVSETTNISTYKKYDMELKNIINKENYDKLSDDSKDFIITANIMYDSLSNIDDGNLDYSGVCLLLTKALEKECTKRFFTAYMLYMKKKYGNNTYKYPSWCVKVSRRGESLVTSSDFTLGTVPYALGLLGDNSEEEKELIYTMYDFCSNELFVNSDIMYIKSTLYIIARQVEDVKNNYRNPAAHISSISKVKAEDCFKYLLQVQKLLQRLLENCKY